MIEWEESPKRAIKLSKLSTLLEKARQLPSSKDTDSFDKAFEEIRREMTDFLKESDISSSLPSGITNIPERYSEKEYVLPNELEGVLKKLLLDFKGGKEVQHFSNFGKTALALTGKKGRGKTSFGKHLAFKVEEVSDKKCLFVEVQQEHLLGPDTNSQSFLRKLYEELESFAAENDAYVILLFDEFQSINTDTVASGKIESIITTAGEVDGRETEDTQEIKGNHKTILPGVQRINECLRKLLDGSVKRKRVFTLMATTEDFSTFDPDLQERMVNANLGEEPSYNLYLVRILQALWGQEGDCPDYVSKVTEELEAILSKEPSGESWENFRGTLKEIYEKANPEGDFESKKDTEYIYRQQRLMTYFGWSQKKYESEVGPKMEAFLEELDLMVDAWKKTSPKEKDSIYSECIPSVESSYAPICRFLGEKIKRTERDSQWTSEWEVFITRLFGVDLFYPESLFSYFRNWDKKRLETQGGLEGLKKLEILKKITEFSAKEYMHSFCIRDTRNSFGTPRDIKDNGLYAKFRKEVKSEESMKNFLREIFFQKDEIDRYFNQS